jgi:hypothetical protein
MGREPFRRPVSRPVSRPVMRRVPKPRDDHQTPNQDTISFVERLHQQIACRRNIICQISPEWVKGVVFPICVSIDASDFPGRTRDSCNDGVVYFNQSTITRWKGKIRLERQTEVLFF